MQTPSEPLEEWLTSVAARIKRWPGMSHNPGAVLTVLVLGTWALLNWLLSIRSIIRDYNPLPVWDYWQVADHLEKYKAFDFSVLWVQHNEHRIVFPETVFAADMLFFHGHQIFSLIVSFACYFGVWLVLAWAFNSDKAISPAIRNAGILFAAIVIGWQGCSVVLGNTFLLQWTMAQLAVVLSLALLAASASRTSYRAVCLAGAILSAIVATYSSGNGMLLWPVLLAAGFLLRIPKRHLLALGASAVLSISLYFVGYQSSGNLQLSNLITHPIYTVGFVCSYLSMPLGALGQPLIAVASGAFNLISFLLLFWVAARKKLLVTTPGIVFFGSFFVILLTAVLTAAGRMNVSDPKFLAALAARYVSLPLVNWAVLLLVLFWISARSKWELLSPSLIGILTFFCFLGLTSALRPWLTGNGSFIADQQVAALSAENNLEDPELDGKLYADPGFITRMLPVLRRNQVAIYTGVPELSWLGKNARTLFAGCDEPQSGTISGVFPVFGGLEIVGSMAHPASSPAVVFVDQIGRVIGFGDEIPAGIPAVVTQPPAKGSTPWVGFINLGYASTSFSTYSVLDHGKKACPMEPARPVPNARQIASAEAAAPVAGVTWTGAGWRENAMPPAVTEKSPNGQPFWTSWDGGDQTTGRITSSAIAVPANHCLVLPALHGPSIDDLRIQILNAADSRPLETIPLKAGETGWKFWQIPLDPRVAQVRVVADDNGAGWGQWIAVASPSQCR